MHPTFHVSLLQLYSAEGDTLGPTDSIKTAGVEEEYEVESILSHSQQGQVTEYLVHWYVYNKADYSWVSEQDLIHAQQILQ